MKRVLECTQESADIRRRLGDMQGLCFSLTFLGEWQLLDGHFREADLYFDEGIALQEVYGKSQFYVRLIVNKAKLAFWRGEFEAATRLLEAGMDFARDQNYLDIRIRCLTVVSYVQCMTGNYTQVQYTSDPPSGVWANWGRALTYCGSGDDAAAHRSVRDTLRYGACSLTFQLLCLPLMSILSARRGDSQSAVEFLGLFSTAPHDLTAWADKWPLLTHVRAELERELGAESYAAAWAVGRALSLEQVVAEASAAPGNNPPGSDAA